ncbi:MAG: S8 family serine peptidase, partial [Actinomycetota bacterium]
MTEIPDSVKYKFSPQLLAEIAVAGTPVKVIIQVAAGTVSLASATIASLGGRVEWQSELTNQISLTIDDGQLAALASLGSILQLFHVPRGELLIHRGVPHAGILPLPQALVATGVTLEETTNYIGAPRLWDRGFRGQGVKVGIVDTGVDKDHPMLDQVVVAERDFTGSGLADTVGHGTWVASAIAGREWLSPLGLMIGVAPEATIVSAKAFNTDNADLDVIMQALEWVALQD